MSQSNTSPSSQSSDILRQVLVVVSTVITIGYNGLSQTIPIGGQTSAQVSNRYETFFTPANYAFAIWGVIYLLLAAYSVYQALPAQRTNPLARASGWLYILTGVLNCVWITLFQTNQLAISVLVIAGFLAALAAIYARLNSHHGRVSLADRWFIYVPFSVYMGWVSVATIANVALFGVASNWGNLLGIDATAWAAIMLVVASVVGGVIASTQRDIGFIAVFVWAFLAIVNKQAATPLVTNTALIMVGVLIVVLGVSLALNSRRPEAPLAIS